MYKYLLESIDQINWLAIVPLVLFFTFFVATLVYVMRINKEHVSKMERLPLDEE